ncbi:MAG: amidohydrolase family protein [Chloroflexi bacterium]|nr:amidohydrolase family protein [Chloroflexota bacterium]
MIRRFARREFLKVAGIGAVGSLASAVAACGDPPLDPAIDSRRWDFAFVDVNVVPMDIEVVLANRTVGVADGRVAWIGPASDVDVPPHIPRVDGQGRYLMPGLADMHIHAPVPDQPIRESQPSEQRAIAEKLAEIQAGFMVMLVANGVTTVRNMWGRQADLALIDRMNREDVLAPTMHTTGPLLDDAPLTWPSATAVTAPAAAEREVVRQKEQGYEFVKVYNNLRPNVYAAITAAARQVQMPVVGHVPWRVGVNAVLAARQSSIEHLWGYLFAARRDKSLQLGAANPQIWVDRVDPALLDGLIRATAAADTWNCPTLVLWHRQQNPNREPESELAPLLRFVPARMLEGWKSANARSASVRVNHERATSIRRVLTKALHDAGAGLLLGTDAPNPFVVYGFSIHDELDHLVEAGLSPFEALRAGTSAAAKYLGTHLGYGSNFGTIAVGERADLILTQENPIQNLRTLRNNDGVMLRGRWLSRSELSGKLKDLTQAIAFTDQLIRDVQ